MSPLTTSTQVILEVLASAIWQEKDKRHADWKERNETVSISRWPPLRWLPQISKFKKVVRYMASKQKSIVLLYISNEQLEFNINKVVLFTISTKTEIIRYKSMNVQDLQMKTKSR